MKKKKVIIFDFDGTIADTEPILRNIYADIAKEKNWTPLNRKLYRKLFTSSIWDAARWSRFQPWRLSHLVSESRIQLKSQSDKIDFFDGVGGVIKELHSKGCLIYILSRNWQVTVQLVIDKNKLSDKVVVMPKPGFFSKHKSVKKLLAKEGYAKDETWLIGDEVRDIYAAKRAGVKSIAVTWGFQDESLLSAIKPTDIARKPKDIISIIL